jgi:hypothetical protein
MSICPIWFVMLLSIDETDDPAAGKGPRSVEDAEGIPITGLGFASPDTFPVCHLLNICASFNPA